ncbi:response regulator [Ramlibacter sp.]|uniref:response regulator transcription factor n=1 Tax=Ramlibacter sp. TaxID=1917967 RepID=UPI002D80BDBB|nr:response regulator [Ramlibacter sp.]
MTALGEQQLRTARTTVSPDELEMLVRVDGRLSVGQMKAGLPADAAPQTEALLERLVRQGMLRLQLEDPFAGQFNFEPSAPLVAQASVEAEAAEASLRRAGYFVRIARRRPGLAVPGAQGLGRLRALVIEDEPQLQKFLEHYLTFEGFEVRAAGDRAGIVEALRQVPLPDLVLLDVVLPDVDGFHVLARMREHPAFKEVPVIMLTARATRDSVIKGLAAGADGYVTKPFEPEALVEAVRTVLGMPAAPGGAASTHPSR